MHSFEGGAKLVFGRVVFGQKKGFSETKKGGGAFFLGGGGVQGLGGCYCMMLLDALEWCSKNL